jgi:radical SAM protein with 4Fe4S-binding SPASM domain
MVIVSGGEPLLRRDFLELIRYGAERGLHMCLGTNGTLLDEETAVKLKEAGVKRVGISLDSVDPEKHDEFRGVSGAWKRAMEGMEACAKARLSFQIHMTITYFNYKEVPSILDLSAEVGADALHLFSLVPVGRAESTEYSPSTYEEVLKLILDLQSSSTIPIRPACTPQFVRALTERNPAEASKCQVSGCLAGISYCRLLPEGGVTPCPYLPVKVGNIREKSFAEIWEESPLFKTLRDSASLKGKCGSCDFRSHCRGCRARAYACYGDYLAEDPACPYESR